jgi:hypothetical protein
VADNPNDITATHDFATLEAAQAFAKSEELKKAMQNTGMVGAPTIWFHHRVQSGLELDIAPCPLCAMGHDADVT